MWDADARMVIPGIASRFDGVRCLTVSNFIAWVRLTMIIEKILDCIPPNNRRVEQRQGNSVKELDEALVVWLKQAGGNYVETATLTIPPHMLLLKLVGPTLTVRCQNTGLTIHFLNPVVVLLLPYLGPSQTHKRHNHIQQERQSDSLSHHLYRCSKWDL